MTILFLLLLALVAVATIAIPKLTPSYDRPVDVNAFLSDGAAAITADGYSQNNSANGQYDTGAADLRFEADLVLDVSAIDISSADETYVLRVVGSNSSTFASGVVVLASIELGRSAAMGPATINKTTGRYVQAIENAGYSTAAGAIKNLQYLRLHVDVGGTTPSIQFTAFLAPRQ